MLEILKDIGIFIAGGIVVLLLHCCLIMAKEADEKMLNEDNVNNKHDKCEKIG